MKLHCEFKMNIAFNMNLTEDEYKQYQEWLKSHPNDIPVDLNGIKEDIFDGIDDIEDERVAEFSDKKHYIVAND